MIKYTDDYEIATIDGYMFRKDKKTGYYLSSKKINGRRKRLHVYVMEKHNGPIPNGAQVHHIDGNKTNNEVKNLVILTRKKHSEEHAKMLTDNQRKKRAENLKTNAVPKSKEWHASEAGHKWHSEHAKMQYKAKKEIAYKCDFCGEEFWTKNSYSEKQNKFCSNKCKAAYRRKMGYDNEIRICICCGKEYEANKYTPRKYCGACWNKEHRPSRKS